MKSISVFVVGSLLISVGSYAGCVWDIVAPNVRQIAQKALGQGDLEVGAYPNEIFSDGGPQTVWVSAERKGVDGEWLGDVGYAVTVRPTDSDLTRHEYSEKCEVTNTEVQYLHLAASAELP